MENRPFTQSELGPLFNNESIYYRNIFIDPTPYYHLDDSAEAREVRTTVSFVFLGLLVLIGLFSLGTSLIQSVKPIPQRAILELKVNKYPV